MFDRLHRSFIGFATKGEPKDGSENDGRAQHKASPIHGLRVDWADAGEAENDAEEYDPQHGNGIDRHAESTKTKGTL